MAQVLFAAGASGKALAGDDDDLPIGQLSHGKDQLKLGLITRTIRDRGWWHYSKMVLKLNKSVQKIATWSEGCPCHSAFYDLGESAKSNLKHALSHLRLNRAAAFGENCCFAGCRAPEVASGRLRVFFSEILDEAHSDLLVTGTGFTCSSACCHCLHLSSSQSVSVVKLTLLTLLL